MRIPLCLGQTASAGFAKRAAGQRSFLEKRNKPNVLVIRGDDIGTWNISHNSRGMMGYTTPNIDRVTKEGVAFTDYYSQQSCTAGRAAFISGSVPVRSGMTKVGMRGAKEGWQKTDVIMSTVLKRQGYATGPFGKRNRNVSMSPSADRKRRGLGTAAGHLIHQKG